MDLLKTKFYLDKLNREFARMSKDPETIVRIDVDIMASYVRELYDAVLSEEEPAVKQEPAPRRPASSRPAVPERPATPIQAPPAPPPPAPAPPPAEEEMPPAAPPPPPPVMEEKPEVAAPVRLKAPVSAPVEADALFEEKQVKELSEKLAEQPVADLKKAIALNDRLLLTRELFAGDGKAFESTIGALNGFTHFEEAKAYLIEHCVGRYMWLDKKRVEEAKTFIKLVRRRYK